ncbi:hypothetical protein [Paucilactobacillus hokkaidonensis]|uniref:hypothetical protein n=1 Tax=Paucilactobacillus hokkaidonensis TaxID=1193095 RepID=UPI0006D225A4|nr:hypothetical protein [Paucilactobacillus hokkaidonensis]
MKNLKNVLLATFAVSFGLLGLAGQANASSYSDQVAAVQTKKTPRLLLAKQDQCISLAGKLLPRIILMFRWLM